MGCSRNTTYLALKKEKEDDLFDKSRAPKFFHPKTIPKETVDKRILPKEVYEYLLKSDFIPKYQWTVINPVTRIRFLAWPYSKDWSWGQVFLKMIVWWLRLFGFKKKIILWSSGEAEFQASMKGTF